MDTYEALTTRTSSRTLTEPGLDDAAIAKLIEMGARAPDHGRLRPWQFLLVRGAARQQLGEVFAEALRRANVEASPEMLRREREKPLRAPVILIVAVTPKEHAAVPEIEQVISGGAAAQNILLAAHASGFGGMWRTGEHAYNGYVRTALRLAPGSHIIGFLYLGTPAATVRAAPAEMPIKIVEWQAIAPPLPPV